MKKLIEIRVRLSEEEMKVMVGRCLEVGARDGEIVGVGRLVKKWVGLGCPMEKGVVGKLPAVGKKEFEERFEKVCVVETVIAAQTATPLAVPQKPAVKPVDGLIDRTGKAPLLRPGGKLL